MMSLTPGWVCGVCACGSLGNSRPAFSTLVCRAVPSGCALGTYIVTVVAVMCDGAVSPWGGRMPYVREGAISGGRPAVVWVVWCSGGAKVWRRVGTAVSLFADPEGGDRDRSRAVM